LAFRKWNVKCEAMKPQKDQFIKNIDKIDNIIPPITIEQKKEITKIINEAWENLFLPVPDECSKFEIHTYMNQSQMEQIQNLILMLETGKDEIYHYFNQKNELDNNIEKCKAKKNQLESIQNYSSLIEKLKNEQFEIIEDQKKVSAELNNINNEIKGLNNDLESKKAVFERENNRFLENMPTNSLIKKANQISKFIESKLIPKLYPIKMTILQREMTSVYKQLAHKKEVDCIKLDENCQVQFLSKDGRELNYDKSAGESQLFATTLMSAIANISGVSAPLVVDTPLARLDSQHRKNILNFWIKNNKSRQVILLCQDEEINTEQYKELKKYISKIYLLSHEKMADGIGETHILEGYFGVN